eukprot:434420_1
MGEFFSQYCCGEDIQPDEESNIDDELQYSQMHEPQEYNYDMTQDKARESDDDTQLHHQQNNYANNAIESMSRQSVPVDNSLDSSYKSNWIPKDIKNNCSEWKCNRWHKSYKGKRYHI